MNDKIGGQRGPFTSSFFPKICLKFQNFEIAVLFRIVEKFNGYVLEVKVIPPVPGEGLQAVNFTHYILIVSHLQGDIFGGKRGVGAMFEDISVEESFMRKGDFP